MRLIDVLIREVDAAAERHSTVHDHDLAVIPVIQRAAQHDHRIELLAFYPLFQERCPVARRKSPDTADVIIQNADVDALRHLLLHDVHHRLPHDTLLDDEILYEHIPFCRFQGGEHLLEQELSDRIVLRRVISENRKPCDPLDISKCLCDSLVLVFHLLLNPRPVI